MIYIDTGAFIARYVKRDQFHDRAVAVWERLAKKPVRLLTSNFVVDETITLLARRTTYDFAAARARALLSSGALTILRPDASDEFAALDRFESFADQQVSYTDAVSFVLMQRRGLQRVFGFDRHFTLAGFDLWPERR